MQIKFLTILKPYKVRYSFTLDGKEVITTTNKVMSRNPDEAIDKVLDEFIDYLMRFKAVDNLKMLSVTVQEMR